MEMFPSLYVVSVMTGSDEAADARADAAFWEEVLPSVAEDDVLPEDVLPEDVLPEDVLPEDVPDAEDASTVPPET